jgi:hypothetical protein
VGIEGEKMERLGRRGRKVEAVPTLWGKNAPTG